MEAKVFILLFFKMRNPNLFIKYILPGILAISLLVVYLLSMSPGLTWANNGSDGGDLITATATGGIAHPTGYPFYLLAARIFQLIPIGSLAFRTNLMSAFAATFASVIIYFIGSRLLFSLNENPSWLAGLVSAYAFGLSPLLWSQAVITEVYTLNALFVAVILFLMSDQGFLIFNQKNQDRVSGLAFGLAIGNHMTAILLLPILLFSSLFHAQTASDEIQSKWKWQPVQRSLLRRVGWMLSGLSVYLILPLRALSNPPVNWGNPQTLSGFAWLISGRQYQDQLFALTLASAWSRIRSVAGLLIGQFGIPGLIIGLIGVVVFYKSSHLFRNTIWIVFAFSVFAIGYETTDSYVYLIPVFMCFAIWIGLGAEGLMELAPQKSRLALGVFFILYLFLMAGTHWRQVDASQDLRAETFGKKVLAQSPEHAMVFAKGDKSIFTMWYFHFALHKRPDLVVVATDLLRFDWYLESLRMTYPELKLPGLFPFAEVMMAENPERPVCFIEYLHAAQIECFPALGLQTP